MKVVFHLNSLDNLSAALSNIKNILKMDVKSVILLINGSAITIFQNPDLDPAITDERFEIFACKNSMRSNNISTESLFDKTQAVDSGVYTLSVLQNQGFAYIKP